MLAKNHRLNRQKFTQVYETGRSLQTDIGYLKFAVTDKKQVSCVASKDELPKSVDRTRARRRGYAVVDDYFDQIPKNVSIIWFLPKTALTADMDQLKNSFQDALSEIKNVTV